MGAFPNPSFDELDEAQKELWRCVVEGPRGRSLTAPVKQLPGPFGPWLHTPRFGRCGAEMGEILRFNSILPGDLREIVILTVGVHWKAAFEFWAHARAARTEGVNEAIIEALRDGTEPAFTTATQKLVHVAAAELLDQGALSEARRDALEAALGRPATVELVALVGFYCMVSFTLNTFDVGLPPGEAPIWPSSER